MRTLIFLLLTSNLAIAAQDIYGGRTDVACGVNGKWTVQKVSNRWMICDPLQHWLWQSGLFLTTNSFITSAAKTAHYGGSNATWALGAVNDMKAWNFNTVQNSSSPLVYATATDSSYPGDHSIPIKYPFVISINAATGGMSNSQFQYSSDNKLRSALTEPVKNICFGVPTSFTSFCSLDPDFFDAKLITESNAQLVNSTNISPYSGSAYLVAISLIDADEMHQGFAGGDQCDANGQNCAFVGAPSLAYTSLVGPYVMTAGCGKNYLGGSTGFCPNANDVSWAIYYDTQVYDKKAALDYLQAIYGNCCAALNTAWGSTYTSCTLYRADGYGSCGTQISNESFTQQPDGRTTSYPSYTLASPTASRNSIAIKVNGTVIAGDQRVDQAWTVGHFFNHWLANNGGSITYGGSAAISGLQFTTTAQGSYAATIESVIYDGVHEIVRVKGEHQLWASASVTVTGTTNGNFTAQAVTIVDPETFQIANTNVFATEMNVGTFTLAAVPQSGDTLKVDYVQGGWGIGNGVADEACNHSWSNSDCAALEVLTGFSTTQINDLDNIDYKIAHALLNGMKTQYRASYPNLLYFGADGISTHGRPARRGILKAAGQDLDYMQIAYGSAFTAAGLSYMYGAGGDFPYLDTYYSTANCDSQYASTSGTPPCASNGSTPKTDAIDNVFATHSLEGADYYTRATADLNTQTYPNGSHPVIGLSKWSYMDMGSQDNNSGWGMKTINDNNYDSVEDVTGSVGCVAPLDGSVTGLNAGTCGSEATNYTNVLNSSRTADGNALWLSLNVSAITSALSGTASVGGTSGVH